MKLLVGKVYFDDRSQQVRPYSVGRRSYCAPPPLVGPSPTTRQYISLLLAMPYGYQRYSKLPAVAITGATEARDVEVPELHHDVSDTTSVNLCSTAAY